MIELAVLTAGVWLWLARRVARLAQRVLTAGRPRRQTTVYRLVTDPDEQLALRRAWEELDAVDVTIPRRLGA